MKPRHHVPRLFLGACLSVLAIAVPALTFAASERPTRALRTVHRVLSRQNCDQEFGAHHQAPDGQMASFSVRPPAGAGNGHEEAPPAVVPAIASALPVDAAPGLLLPQASSAPLSRPFASRFGRAPPRLS